MNNHPQSLFGDDNSVNDTIGQLPSLFNSSNSIPILSEDITGIGKDQNGGFQPISTVPYNENQQQNPISGAFESNQSVLNDNVLDTTNTESTASAKSYISMNEEFLNNQEESWNKRNPLAMFDFTSEPTEEWAKQIVYYPAPFENVIRSGSTQIEPNVYFSLRTPEETDLHVMLNSITLEKDALNIDESLTRTQVKSLRKPSEPFSKPSVTLNEKTEAAALIQANGIVPVSQGIQKGPDASNTATFQPEVQTQSDDLNTVPIQSEVQNERNNLNTTTIQPEVPIDLSNSTPQVEVISSIDLEEPMNTIPSLRDHDARIPVPAVSEIHTEDSSFVLNESLFETPHLPSIPKPVSPSSSPFPIHYEIPKKTEPPKPIQTEPILDVSVETTVFPGFVPSVNPPKNEPVPIFSGSNSDLIDTILFGSREAAKEVMILPPVEQYRPPLSTPLESIPSPQGPQLNPMPGQMGPLPTQPSEVNGLSSHMESAQNSQINSLNGHEELPPVSQSPQVESSTVPQVPRSEVPPFSPLYSSMSSPINSTASYGVQEKPRPGIRVEPTSHPVIIAESTVIGFGCVPLQMTSNSSVCLRSTSNDIVTISLSLQSINSDSSVSPFVIISSSTILLQPGETTTVLVSYSPYAIQEDLALLLISTPTSKQQQIIPVVGYGGESNGSITENNSSLVIGNSGSRTACFLVLEMNHGQIDLVRSSNCLPPFFMLPSMMEFSISGETIKREIQERKLPSQIRILAVDNVLKRRLLMGLNRNALIRCSDPVEILLLHAIQNTSESASTTHSLLKTMKNVPTDMSTVDITHDMDDGEGVTDFDTFLGKERNAISHYLDVKMMISHLKGVSVNLSQIGNGSSYEPSKETDQGFDFGHSIKSPNPVSPVDPMGPIPPVHQPEPLEGVGLSGNIPQMDHHNYLYEFTQENDSSPFIASQDLGVKSSNISVIPQLIYITPGELKRDQISIFNHSTENVFFSIPDVPQQINVSPTQGVINKLSSFLLTIELSQIGVYQLGRTLHMKIYVDKIDFDIEIRIQAFADEGPHIEITNDPSMYVATQELSHQPQPSFSPVYTDPQVPGTSTQPYPLRNPQGPSVMAPKQVKVDTVSSIHFKGAAGMNKDVVVKDNYIMIPAGMTTSQLFKTVFYNYSSHSVRVSLDSILPPFECSYRDFIIKPKRKVRVPIAYRPNGRTEAASCCVNATVSYDD